MRKRRKATMGRTSAGRLKKGYRLTAGGRVVKANKKRARRR
jgi:hypothetical protein